ncbi:MAG: hypothetical protein AABX38_05410 [Candidatus Micrarchaeota archaeon]
MNLKQLFSSKKVEVIESRAKPKQIEPLTDSPLKSRVGTLGRVVAAALTFACTENTYIYGNVDAGVDSKPAQMDATTNQDRAQNPDASQSPVCPNNGPAIPCNLSVSGTINLTESISFATSDGRSFSLRLDDLEALLNTKSAIVSILDNDCLVVKQAVIAEGATISFNVGQSNFNITADQIAIGYSFASKWATLTITNICSSVDGGLSNDAGTDRVASGDATPDAGRTCTPNPPAPAMCSSVSGIISRGESIIYTTSNLVPVAIQLDDLVISPSSISAALSILDRDCAIIRRLLIPGGQTANVWVSGSQLSVTANRLAPGYTFNAVWADLTVSDVCSSDAGTD